MSKELSLAEQQVAESGTLLSNLKYLALLGVVVFLILVTTYTSKFGLHLSSSQEHWGQFGDFLGGVLNPVFSFFALLGLLATIALQVKQLRVSAHELRSSEEALAAQHTANRIQSFESSFFQLLGLLSQVVNAIDLVSQNGRETKGRDCFRVFVHRLEKDLKDEGGNKNFGTFLAVYEVFYVRHEHEIGHYFRLLYNIVKLVKRTEGIDKKYYTNLIRAQLSSNELKLLFYNCISEWGQEKFKPLVEEFALLKTLPRSVLPDDELLHQYSPAAFGGAYPKELF